MIEGFGNISFKNCVVEIIKKVEKSDKDCNECDSKKVCWYRELEIRCGQMRRY